MNNLTLDNLYEHRIKILRRCRAGGMPAEQYQAVEAARTNEELKLALYEDT